MRRVWIIFFTSALSMPCEAASIDLANPAIEIDTEAGDASWLSWLSWSPSSQDEVRQAERNILKYVHTSSQGFFVNIGLVGGERCRVWTRMFGPPGQGIPLVMVHGMG